MTAIKKVKSLNVDYNPSLKNHITQSTDKKTAQPTCKATSIQSSLYDKDSQRFHVIVKYLFSIALKTLTFFKLDFYCIIKSTMFLCQSIPTASKWYKMAFISTCREPVLTNLMIKKCFTYLHGLKSKLVCDFGRMLKSTV